MTTATPSTSSGTRRCMTSSRLPRTPSRPPPTQSRASPPRSPEPVEGLLPVVLVIILAMGFNYTNGFHDAANAIATSVSTRALTPRAALLMAAFFNLLGAFLGTGVAQTVGSGIIDPPSGMTGLAIVAAALVGAIG